MSNIIDSFFVALGYKVDSSGIEDMKRKVDSAKSSILSWGTAITGLISGAALAKVAELGSKFEQNKIQIAGFLSALGLSSDFNAGLVDAAAIIQKITADAARLPGEAEEYVEVFKANAAFLKNAMPGADANQMADFTNRLTAVAKTVASTLDATQIARESSQLLAAQGRAGGHNVLWQKLMPFLMQVQGQANITAQSFNAMTQPKRVELLNAAFAKLQPMLDASADSFDAMWGAAVSGAKQLARMGTSSLFASMKKGLASLTSTFIDSDSNLTKTGRDVVAVLESSGKVVGSFLDAGAAFVAWLSDNDAAASTLLMTLKVLAVVVGGFGLAVALVAQDVWGFYNGMDSVTGELVEGWGPAIYVVIGALILLTAAFSPLLLAVGAVIFAVYELKKNWQDVLDFVEGGLNGWVNVLNEVIDALNKVNRFMGADENHLIKKISGFTFAREHQANEWAQSNMRPGEGVIAPGASVSPSQDDAGNHVFQPSYGPQPGQQTDGYWQPGFSMAGAGGSSVKHGDTHIGQINITAPDAKSAGDEVVRRLSRTSQSGLVR